MEGHFVRISEIRDAGGEWQAEHQQLSWKLFDALQQAAVQTGTAGVEGFNGDGNEGCGYFQVDQRDRVR